MADRITDADLAELEAALADERLWPAPWVARRFEIDCPCPNGQHCGDQHTCDEVEAPEAYPNGPFTLSIDTRITAATTSRAMFGGPLHISRRSTAPVRAWCWWTGTTCHWWNWRAQ